MPMGLVPLNEGRYHERVAPKPDVSVLVLRRFRRAALFLVTTPPEATITGLCPGTSAVVTFGPQNRPITGGGSSEK